MKYLILVVLALVCGFLMPIVVGGVGAVLAGAVGASVANGIGGALVVLVALVLADAVNNA